MLFVARAMNVKNAESDNQEEEEDWPRVGVLRLNGSYRTMGNKDGFEDMKFTQEWPVRGVEFRRREFRLGRC